MIESIPKRASVRPSVRVVCDVCGADIEVRGKYVWHGRTTAPSACPRQVKTKLLKMGWVSVGSHEKCPACHKKQEGGVTPSGMGEVPQESQKQTQKHQEK